MYAHCLPLLAGGSVGVAGSTGPYPEKARLIAVVSFRKECGQRSHPAFCGGVAQLARAHR